MGTGRHPPRWKETTRIPGTLELRIPRDREGVFQGAILPERIQFAPRIEQSTQFLQLRDLRSGGAELRVRVEVEDLRVP